MLNLVNDPMMAALPHVVNGFGAMSPLLETAFKESPGATDMIQLTRKHRSEDTLRVFRDATHKLQEFQFECDNTGDSDTNLAHAITHLPRLEKLVATVEVALEAVMIEFGRELVTVELGELLTKPVEDFKKLRLLAQRLSPGHLAMQGHILYLVFAGPPMSEADYMRIYTPLFILRDEYFTDPREGMLSAYLLAAESLTSSSVRTLLGIKGTPNRRLQERMQVEVDKHAERLEILSLMDTLLLERGIK